MEVSFWPCLIGCTKKVEVGIPPAQYNWITLLFIRECLLKQMRPFV